MTFQWMTDILFDIFSQHPTPESAAPLRTRYDDSVANHALQIKLLTTMLPALLEFYHNELTSDSKNELLKYIKILQHIAPDGTIRTSYLKPFNEILIQCTILHTLISKYMAETYPYHETQLATASFIQTPQQHQAHQLTQPAPDTRIPIATPMQYA